MADVTGPIRTLSGAIYEVPEGQKCDNHPRRKAVVRVQGETDSFGCEMHDLCQECFDKDRAWEKSAEAAEWRKGKCEWCGNTVDDLRDARDYDEGLYGRVYRVCAPCVKRRDDEARREMDYYDDPYVRCPTCKGSGTVNPLTAPSGFFCTGTTDCPTCDGIGEV